MAAHGLVIGGSSINLTTNLNSAFIFTFNEAAAETSHIIEQH